MSFDWLKAFDVRNGLVFDGALVIVGGEDSPVGNDAPIGSIYFRTNKEKWKKTGAGVNDWTMVESGNGVEAVYFSIASSVNFVTNSRVDDEIVPEFSLTPIAGTYACFYSALSSYSSANKYHYWSFYRSGVKQSYTERQAVTGQANQVVTDYTLDLVSFNGSQDIDVRVRCDNTGTLTVGRRALLLMRLGN